MIEVVIDFNEISFDNELLNKYKDKKYSHIPKTIKSALIIYLCKKLNIPGVFGWDAFSDNFTELFRPEILEDYEYNPNDEWGWSDYQDYLNYLQDDREMGLKNEKGRRDDLRIIFVNFYPFYYKYSSIAQKLLEYMVDSYAQSCIYKKWDDDDDCLKLKFCIKS
jgi:hypothetical protein